MTAIVTTPALPYNISAAELDKYLDPILNPNNTNPGLPYTDNFAVRKVGNDYILTFQGEHANLSIHELDTRELGTTALRTTLTLSGTPQVGEIWSVTLPILQDNFSEATRTYSYTVIAGDTLTPEFIAEKLASRINIDGT